MWVYVSVYAHTHTHTAQIGYGCEPRSRDETPGGPEESRRTKSQHIHIRICVQRTRVHVYARRRDEILYYLTYFSFSKKKSKGCERKPPIISNL